MRHNKLWVEVRGRQGIILYCDHRDTLAQAGRLMTSK